MWFNRLFASFRLRRITNAAQDLSPTKPHRPFAEATLVALNPVEFHRYSPAVGMATTISVYYPNVELYTRKLKEAANLVSQGKAISPDWVALEEIETSVDRFLISDDGYYLNPAKSIHDLKLAGLALCKIMEPSDTETAGFYEHNLRMLTKLFINLRGLTLALMNVSLTS